MRVAQWSAMLARQLDERFPSSADVRFGTDAARYLVIPPSEPPPLEEESCAGIECNGPQCLLASSTSASRHPPASARAQSEALPLPEPSPFHHRIQQLSATVHAVRRFPSSADRAWSPHRGTFSHWKPPLGWLRPPQKLTSNVQRCSYVARALPVIRRPPSRQGSVQGRKGPHN